MRLAHVSVLMRAKKSSASDNSWMEEENAKEKKAKAKQEAKAKEVQKEKEAAAAVAKAEEQRKLEEETEAKKEASAHYGPKFRIIPGVEVSDIEFDREKSAKKKKLMPKGNFDIRTCVKGLEVPWPQKDEDYPPWIFTEMIKHFPATNAYLPTHEITDLKSFKKNLKRARKQRIKAQNNHSREAKGIGHFDVPLSNYFLKPEKEEINDVEKQLLDIEKMPAEEKEEYLKEFNETFEALKDPAKAKLLEEKRKKQEEQKPKGKREKEKEKEKEKKDTPKEKEKDKKEAPKDKGKGKK